MDQMLLSHYAAWMWVAAGLTMVFLEVVMGFPMVLFICGLAAFTAALIIWMLPFINDSSIYQIIVFLAGIPLWTMVLWKPLKNALSKSKHLNNFSNIVGQTATVAEEALVKNKIGQIRWSGTFVKARLADDETKDRINVDDDVTIVEVKENIFIVKSSNK